MQIEISIGSGPPVAIGAAWITLHQVVETRVGVKKVFDLLVLLRRDLDHDEFLVFKTAEAIGAGAENLIWELSRQVLRRPLLILDEGMDAQSLSAAQLRARMGLS